MTKIWVAVRLDDLQVFRSLPADSQTHYLQFFVNRLLLYLFYVSSSVMCCK